MKLVKLKVASGFKMLEKNFEINFLTKTRIDKDSENNDLFELDDNVFYPHETIFIGKNSSGKTTVLELIMIAFELLNEGRISKDHFEYGDYFDIEIVFHLNKTLFKYVGSFENDTLSDKSFLTIKNESLTKTTIKDSYKKDLSNAAFFKINDFASNIDADTSMITKYSNDGSFNFSLELLNNSIANFGLFYDYLGKDLFDTIIRLFDDSITLLEPIKDNNLKNTFLFKRVNDSEHTIVEARSLSKVLSKGTIRGVNLYSLAILTFLSGGNLLVDEIESSFNKNLIENLILMYNDDTINLKHGCLIYSTHYSELLDSSSRCDNVNVLHREGSVIKLKNMHSDYNIRTEMLKSAQFDQNTFDTLINYDRLMDLKEAIREKEKHL